MSSRHTRTRHTPNHPTPNLPTPIHPIHQPRVRHHSRTAPRNWTEEQVQFVLDRVNGASNKEIETAFNRHFRGAATIAVNSIKYIRTTYGRDPNWGAVCYPKQRAGHGKPMSVPGTQTGIPSQRQALAVQPDSVKHNHNLLGNDQFAQVLPPPLADNNNFAPAPAPLGNAHHPTLAEQPDYSVNDYNHQDFDMMYPLAPLEAFHSASIQTQSEQKSPLNLPSPLDLHSPNLDIAFTGTWHEGTHGSCDLCVQHRHDPDGGVYFASVPTVKTLAGRMHVQGDVATADIMEHIRAEFHAMKEMQKQMLAQLEASDGIGQPSAAPVDARVAGESLI